MKISYRKKRYFFYSLLSLILTFLPFITINNNQIFLLSFIHKELHLMGVVFNVQEFFLVPFLLIGLFVGIFFITSLYGRIWCGWGCPQTIFRVIYRDLIETKILGLHKSISNKQLKAPLTINNIFKKFIAIVLFSFVAFLASATFLFYFVPPKEFFSYLANPFDHTVLFIFWICIALFMIIDIVWIAENFCIYMCPYARVQSVLYDDNTKMVIYDTNRGGLVYGSDSTLLAPPKKRDINNECINCHQCVKVCPTHIDIRKGMQLECINCLECVDACTSVMKKFDKPTLVNWSSFNAITTKSKIKYLRAKTMGYIAVLLIALCVALLMFSQKTPLLVNIDRNTQLYEVRKSGAVDNFYTFLFENPSKSESYFSFSINHKDIEIIKPKGDIKVKSHSKIKEVVILRAKNLEVQNDINDVLIPIEIVFYKVDNPKIRIKKKSIFVYPKKERLQKSLESKSYK
ncbi:MULTISPECIES: cytochrome c oxidase accessory protein CcoG [unclassified Helicobacter]|uniref:cytochrome c oxidase accessory protein CcoG n=1 Tax=unclassified Helicobacter TaxID=2593540 RepID=UPI000CF1BEED|nr:MULTISPECIES: cytochrome c oxidase accessory protein CcoG [unclassified Helicobacter]